jgi:hypothetical protein
MGFLPERLAAYVGGGHGLPHLPCHPTGISFFLLQKSISF